MTGLIRSEFLKIRTTKMWWGLLLGALAFTAVSVVATVLTAGVDTGPGGPQISSLDAPATIRNVYASGFAGAYLFALILGIIGMTGEYRHQTVTPTFLATPRRSRLITAKLVTSGLFGLIYGVVCTALAVALGASMIAAKGYPTRITSDQVPQTIGLCLLGVVVWTIVGLGIGILIKNQIAAILVAVGVNFILEPLASALLNHFDLAGIPRYFPGAASNAIVQGVQSANAHLLPWWGGTLVLIAYGVVFAVLGAVLTLRRDVT